jgi:hypothetical protein
MARRFDWRRRAGRARWTFGQSLRRAERAAASLLSAPRG